MGRVDTVPANFEQIRLLTEDNKSLLAWFSPAKKNQKTILYFHGNAGNIGDRSHRLSVFAENGFGVLAISYRGYFGSSGSPSEQGLIKDGESGLKFLFDSGLSGDEIILFGESLGSGVAVQLAAKNNFYAVILESPFSSILSVAQDKYWFAPVSLLLKDKFNSIEFAPKIFSPVLIFHGDADSVVPIAEGKKLFASLKCRKKFVEVQGVGHVDFTPEFLLKQLLDFQSSTNPEKKF